MQLLESTIAQPSIHHRYQFILPRPASMIRIRLFTNISNVTQQIGPSIYIYFMFLCVDCL
jgi:hypothetical protein